jgi:L-rhamnose mutarotase
MIRKAFVMSVDPEQHEEYERRHRPIWPELSDVLSAHGASNYSIFLDPDSSKLFGFVEIESEEEWASVADTDICKMWWAHMKDIMPSNPDNSPISVELTEVFHLD